mmetsp:Transcript_85746/g.227875  ORF Transcript_85746/g.227875 Transcript_85746/m.227875 type:complete len:212 (-) Transcript_85746:537-1172(-)
MVGRDDVGPTADDAAEQHTAEVCAVGLCILVGLGDALRHVNPIAVQGLSLAFAGAFPRRPGASQIDFKVALANPFASLPRRPMEEPPLVASVHNWLGAHGLTQDREGRGLNLHGGVGRAGTRALALLQNGVPRLDIVTPECLVHVYLHLHDGEGSWHGHLVRARAGDAAVWVSHAVYGAAAIPRPVVRRILASYVQEQLEVLKHIWVRHLH